MFKRYSIAEARQKLAAIVHELEQKAMVEITRRGEPVAVLLSMREYRRLHSPNARFWQAYEAFRRQVNLSRLNLEPSIFAGLRDQSPGREVRW